MTLAQFGDDSDVYVFDTGDEIICQWCKLGNGSANWSTRGKNETLGPHLAAHRDTGHKIPDELLNASGRDEAP